MDLLGGLRRAIDFCSVDGHHQKPAWPIAWHRALDRGWKEEYLKESGSERSVFDSSEPDFSIYLSEEGLEVESSSQLHLAKRIRIRDLSSAGDTYSYAGVRLREVGVVEDIEGICPNLKFYTLNQGKRLAQTEVEIAPVRSDQRVPSYGAVGPIGWRCKCSSIEPLSYRRI